MLDLFALILQHPPHCLVRLIVTFSAPRRPWYARAVSLFAGHPDEAYPRTDRHLRASPRPNTNSENVEGLAGGRVFLFHRNRYRLPWYGIAEGTDSLIHH